jgi:hypothetical protein
MFGPGQGADLDLNQPLAAKPIISRKTSASGGLLGSYTTTGGTTHVCVLISPHAPSANRCPSHR